MAYIYPEGFRFFFLGAKRRRQPIVCRRVIP